MEAINSTGRRRSLSDCALLSSERITRYNKHYVYLRPVARNQTQNDSKTTNIHVYKIMCCQDNNFNNERSNITV